MFGPALCLRELPHVRAMVAAAAMSGEGLPSGAVVKDESGLEYPPEPSVYEVVAYMVYYMSPFDPR